MLKKFLLLPLILSLMYAGCGTATEKAGAPQPHSGSALPIGSLDAPKPNGVLKGGVMIGGWAAHESGIKSVSIYLDRDYVMEATIGVDRPDVAAAFPNFKKSMISGWNALLQTGAFKPGRHELLARVQANDGSHRDLSVPASMAAP